jgi:Glyoxalase/Bleomycin resistance protein/Dioxygenase superfamily
LRPWRWSFATTTKPLPFFATALRFILVEDTPLGGGKRWVRVAPSGVDGLVLLLAKAATPQQQAAVGNQTIGRVFLFLETSDFWDDFRHMQSCGVRFIVQPRQESYGLVAVFLDLYGNKWDLLQRDSA